MEAIEAINRRVISCTRCPRLVQYREEVARAKKRAFIDDEYWGRPVPSFGDPRAPILVVGLAPAAHGANRTGRMFTGDGTDTMGAGSFLMRALYATGFASQPYSIHVEDGLELTGLYISASVRCAPPENKPLRSEIETCRSWMLEELDALPGVRVIVALGRLAFDEMLITLAHRGVAIPRPRPRFGHGVEITLAEGAPVLLGSYHPSRQNTQTRVLTPAMLEAVFLRARTLGAQH